jgi:hypothetical protein
MHLSSFLSNMRRPAWILLPFTLAISLANLATADELRDGLVTSVTVIYNSLSLLPRGSPEELEKVRLVADGISHQSTTNLRYYQFVDNVCASIACNGLSSEKVKALIGVTIGVRDDAEKNLYTRVSTLTGAISVAISVISLIASFLSLRRSKIGQAHQQEPPDTFATDSPAPASLQKS